MERKYMNYGSWALITGASAGIGEEFARQLAAKRMNVVLVARREDKLNHLALELEEKYSIQTRTASIDLMSQDFLAEIKSACNGLDIALVVSNAGYPSYVGPFLNRSLYEVEQMLTFNTIVQAKIVHCFANEMAAKNGGGIVMVSSFSAYGPIPYLAEYCSSKSFQLVFGEALHYELKAKGIDVLVLCPGITKSERVSFGVDAAPVVSLALKSLGEKASVLPGWKNNWDVFVGRYLKSRKRYLFDYGRRLELLMAGGKIPRPVDHP